MTGSLPTRKTRSSACLPMPASHKKRKGCCNRCRPLTLTPTLTPALTLGEGFRELQGMPQLMSPPHPSFRNRPLDEDQPTFLPLRGGSIHKTPYTRHFPPLHYRSYTSPPFSLPGYALTSPLFLSAELHDWYNTNPAGSVNFDIQVGEF